MASSPIENVEEVTEATAPVEAPSTTESLVEVTTDFDFQTNGVNLPAGTHSVSAGVAEDLKRRNNECLEQERLRFTGQRVNVNSGSINAAGK